MIGLLQRKTVTQGQPQCKRNPSTFSRRESGFKRINSDLENQIRSIASQQRIRSMKYSEQVLSCKSDHFTKLCKHVQPTFMESILHFSVRPWLCAVVTNFVVTIGLLGKCF